jgi:putative membrane protein
MVDRLSRLSGTEFDREFIDVMVQEHRKSVQMYEQQARPAGAQEQSQAARQSEDAKVANELLPTVRQHLASAEQIQRELLSRNPR